MKSFHDRIYPFLDLEDIKEIAVGSYDEKQQMWVGSDEPLNAYSYITATWTNTKCDGFCNPGGRTTWDNVVDDGYYSDSVTD